MISWKRFLVYLTIITLSPFLFVYIVNTYPYFVPAQEAHVYFVGETNILKEQTIFLESDDDTIIKINNTSSPIYFMEGDEIKGYFFETEKQKFYHSRTGTYFQGQVLHKRALNPNLPAIEAKNIYIKGKNNIYTNNTVIKGENNISQNNTYIAGNNNTITGNTHYQGSNNVYEDNVVIGSSGNTITNTTTYGSSNRTVKDQVTRRASGNGYSSSSDSWWNEPIIDADNPIFKAFCYICYAFLFLVAVYACCFIIAIHNNSRHEFFKKCKWFTLFLICFFAFAITIFVLRKIYMSLSAIHICLILSVVITGAAFYFYRIIQKNKEEAKQRRIEYEKEQAERKQKEQEMLLKYKQEQDRISALSVHYVGNRTTGKYHHCNCTYAKKLSPAKKEYFETITDAKEAGYSPCSICEHIERS